VHIYLEKLASSTLFESYVLNEVNQSPPARECSDIYYGNNGEDCDPSRNSKKRCKSFYGCRNNKCTYAHIGSQCSLDTDCDLNDPLLGAVRCVNNICIKPRYNGQFCSHDRHCFGGSCQNSLCAGRKLGTACEPQKLVQCDQNLYCDLYTKKCENQLNLGDQCSYFGENNEGDWGIEQGSNYMITCKGGLKCSGPYGRKACLQWRSGEVGSPCNWDRDGSSSCRFGLFCGYDSRCSNLMNIYPSFACIGSPRNCTFAENEDCICNAGTKIGTCKSTADFDKCGFNKVAQEYRDCFQRNNCAYEKNFFTSWLLDSVDRESCGGKNCGHLLRGVMCCAFEKYRREKFSQYAVGPLGCSNNAGTVVLVILSVICVTGLIVVSIAIALGIVGVVIWKKRKQQDQNAFQNIE